MAGIFGLFDFTKPGPGVQKNAPPKPRAIVFFEIFFRKFWHLVKLNMLFFLLNLPAILIMPFIAQIFAHNLIKSGGIDGEGLYALAVYFALGAVFICIPVVTVGPSQAGFTYVLRNFAREEHAFIGGDFKEHALKNIRESAVICFIDLVAVFIVSIDISFYFRANRGNFLLSALSGLVVLFFVIFLMMHLYIYPMLVTFKLSVKQIYKNALIFAVIRFFPNLGILLLCSALTVIPLLIYPVVGIPLFFFITISAVGLITNFYVYPTLKKYMIDKLPDSDKAEPAG